MTKHVNLGDIHDQKSVILIKKNGTQRIRKPRNAATEKAFSSFLLRLKEEGFLYLPGCVNILTESEDEHEVSVVMQTGAASEEEISLYYKRCGVLLFFAYLFSAKDLHDENIIAGGSFPIIVDYETLLSGVIDRKEYRFESEIAVSVLGTHLLSHWHSENGRDVDHGGITGENGGKNILWYKGVPLHAYNHYDEIREGFIYAYDFVLARIDFFKTLLHLFDDCFFRILLRSTEQYNELIRRSRRKDEEREIYVRTMLERAYSRDIDPNRLNEARLSVEYETDSVLNGEVPLFYVKGNSLDLCTRKGIVWKKYLKLSPVQNAERKLNMLSCDDRDSQIRIIRQALQAVKPCNSETRSDPEKCADAVTVLFKEIEIAKIKTLSSGWLGLSRDTGGRLCLHSAGFGLYNGLPGILCTYAAIYSRYGCTEVFEALLSLYENYRKRVLGLYYDDRTGSILRELKLNDYKSSLQEGIGGQLMALHHLFELTGDIRFLTDAENLLKAVKAADLPDGSCDVLTGYSGLALVLPYMNNYSARKIAEALSSKIIKADVKLTGTAHGASGIALALGALGHVLDTDLFDDRILEILRWENNYYDEKECNWQDLRYQNRKGFMFGWCSGSPGIGMARKKLLEYTNNEEIRKICQQDIARVFKGLHRKGKMKYDNLCCGNSAVLMASSALGAARNDIVEEMGSRVIKKQINLVRVAGTCDICSGLMQGIAGIGYSLAMAGDERSGGMLF